MLGGKWTYRSYLNDPVLVDGDEKKALALIFGEGVFEFSPAGHDRFHGRLDMGSGFALTLEGRVTRSHGGESYAIVGEGIDGTPTAGWRYDYHCAPGYHWPNGVDQVPSLVGTVIRVKAHGPNSPAGFTASFIAIRQPEAKAA
ncbi:MAG: hypothetical protein JO013_15595 [Alphaproteobacteria bacterium]|nr:hypothetical protein [Alphaproteobacteria bacterium]